MQVYANDSDLAENGDVRFQLSEGPNWMAVDPVSGRLFAKSNFQSQETTEFNTIVKAIDQDSVISSRR